MSEGRCKGEPNVQRLCKAAVFETAVINSLRFFNIVFQKSTHTHILEQSGDCLGERGAGRLSPDIGRSVPWVPFCLAAQGLGEVKVFTENGDVIFIPG